MGCCDSSFQPDLVTATTDTSSRLTTVSFWYPVPKDSHDAFYSDLRKKLSEDAKKRTFRIEVTIVTSANGRVSLKNLVDFLFLLPKEPWYGRVVHINFVPHGDLEVAPEIRDFAAVKGVLDGHKRAIRNKTFSYSFKKFERE